MAKIISKATLTNPQSFKRLIDRCDSDECLAKVVESLWHHDLTVPLNMVTCSVRTRG